VPHPSESEDMGAGEEQQQQQRSRRPRLSPADNLVAPPPQGVVAAQAAAPAGLQAGQPRRAWMRSFFIIFRSSLISRLQSIIASLRHPLKGRYTRSSLFHPTWRCGTFFLVALLLFS
jgi:hypothetical protein